MESSATRRRAITVVEFSGDTARSVTEEAKASNDDCSEWGNRKDSDGVRSTMLERRMEEGGRVTGRRSGE